MEMAMIEETAYPQHPMGQVTEWADNVHIERDLWLTHDEFGESRWNLVR